jgi:hypothetical protein
MHPQALPLGDAGVKRQEDGTATDRACFCPSPRKYPAGYFLVRSLSYKLPEALGIVFQIPNSDRVVRKEPHRAHSAFSSISSKTQLSIFLTQLHVVIKIIDAAKIVIAAQPIRSKLTLTDVTYLNYSPLRPRKRSRPSSRNKPCVTPRPQSVSLNRNRSSKDAVVKFSGRNLVAAYNMRLQVLSAVLGG